MVYDPEGEKDPMDRLVDLLQGAMDNLGKTGHIVPEGPSLLPDWNRDAYRAFTFDVFKVIVANAPANTSFDDATVQALKQAQALWTGTEMEPIAAGDVIDLMPFDEIVDTLADAVAEIEAHNDHASHVTPPETLARLQGVVGHLKEMAK